jgi:hypothetical protein
MSFYNVESQDQKTFELHAPPLQARYFHTNYSCGITSIQMTLEKTMEYILPGGNMNVECPRASLIHKFESGSLVILSGHLWVQFALVDSVWKIGHLDFTFSGHEEYINRIQIPSPPISKKKNQLPDSLVNKWGIPPRVFHILQMADIVTPRISEIIFHSLVAGSTPRESLEAMAFNKQPQPQPIVVAVDHSPIVKTQTGITRPNTTTTLQQQAALRQQANANGFQFPPTPQQQYPINNNTNTNNTPNTPNNNNTNQQQQQFPPPQSPVSRKFFLRKGRDILIKSVKIGKRNSSTTDVKSSPIARKKNATTPRK